MNKVLLLSLILISVNNLYPSQDTLQIRNSDVTLIAKKIDSPIQLDGVLDESVWYNQKGFENFIQRDPDEGANPTERTIIKLAYDKNSLYLAARMFDSSPDSIIARLTRRDELVDCDYITLALDPYHDKRSGYYFSLS